MPPTRPSRRTTTTLLLLLFTPTSAAAVADQHADINGARPRVVEVQPHIRTVTGRVLDVRPRATGRLRTVPSDVLFAFGSDTLSPDATAVLGPVTTELGQAHGRVLVTGYTDSIGDSASNRALSKRRAQAVRDVLAAQAPQLEYDVQGRGETQPVALEIRAGRDDPDARRLNRRVTITLPA